MRWNNAWLWRSLILIGLLLAVFFSISTLVPPDWTACVADEAGQPLSQRYSSERTTRITLPNPKGTRKIGIRALPVVYILPLSLCRCLCCGAWCSRSISDRRRPRQFRPHDSVIAFDGAATGSDIRDRNLYKWTGSPRHVNSRLVLRSR